MSLLIRESDIKHNLQHIQTKISVSLDTNNPQEIQNHLLDLSQLLSLSAVLQTSCKYFLEEKRKQAFNLCAEQLSVLGATLGKQLIDSYCSVELSAFTLAERQNKAIVHQMDALRSVLSFSKSELQNLK